MPLTSALPAEAFSRGGGVLAGGGGAVMVVAGLDEDGAAGVQHSAAPVRAKTVGLIVAVAEEVPMLPPLTDLAEGAGRGVGRGQHLHRRVAAHVRRAAAQVDAQAWA